MVLDENTQKTDESTLVESGDDKVVAYLLSDGEVVDVNKAGFSSSKKKGKKNSSDSNSIDTDEDDFGEQYASGRVYRPTLKFSNMKNFSMENLYHSRCIKQIAIDTTSSGWDIKTVDDKGNELPNDVKWSTKDNKLYNFFQDAFGMDLFPDGVASFIVNLNTFGVAFLEMTRKKGGEPARLRVLPTETCRIARDLSMDELGDTDQKYVVQIVNTHERIFKIFDGERPIIKEPHTNQVMTEVFVIRNYHVMGGKYGIPDWVPALKAMVGNDKVAEYNINFFDNEAVPRFAVVVQGGKLDDETRKDIKSYFKKDLKGVQNAHKTLVLTTPKGTEVKLMPLASDMKDGGFRYYRKDNRDEVISAHSVPPHRVQVYDAGNNGVISPSMIFNLDKTYKYSVVNPMQTKMESVLNKIIRLGFGLKNKQIKFNELDIGEEADRANTLKTIAAAHERYYNIGTMTPDDIRKDNHQVPYSETSSDTDVKEWASTPKPVYLLRQAQLQAQQDYQLNSNVGGQGVNEVPNEFGDKSKEQTGNTLTDKNIQQLMMKSDSTEAISKINDLCDMIEDLQEQIQSLGGGS